MPPEALIHVIDDDEAMRESLGFLLDSAGFEARTYDSALGFLEAAQDLAGGCIVTDVRMPGMNGLEMTLKLKAMGVGLPIVMITGHGDVPMAVESMKAGVADFLEKPFDDEALLRAIRSAMAVAARPAPSAGASTPFDALSPRERDVLAGMIEGKANKVIAFDLGISPRTVEVYRANVMTKTGAGSLAELVRMAMTAGLA
ncbi:two-component system response regulator FixJ [Caulobacter ginsengisoli]|uniref:Two-component system response regulator FixJ n=1 Tax=Caulobacter ginsengisoli TaxID=400775 RepID=A0ABU0IVD4_9CAUL|nr:response regulator FixJ [Caulobacter ginsengisoli]MDQ0465978.1 two-component system response regulator FixJ [Caulobacter ginsengisoli]